MELKKRLRTLASGLLDLVFAPVCVACGDALDVLDPVRVICKLCWVRARQLPAPHCPRCFNPRLGTAHDVADCPVCADLIPGVRSLRSAYLMTGSAREMVYALKYRGWEAAAEPMGRQLADVPLPEDVQNEARLVVPVPVSDARLRQRGYNQAALLAAAYARASGRRAAPELLVRTRATETQTALHPDERRANVARAFAVLAECRDAVRQEHVLLVDDVWTTGATALECARTLLDAGARAVSIVTFARALAALHRQP